MANNARVREFTAEDYEGFCEIEAWVDGCPLIREFDQDCVGIADANGIGIYVPDNDGLNTLIYMMYQELDREFARVILEGLPQDLNRPFMHKCLTRLGFVVE